MQANISDTTNPKDLLGMRKPPLWLVPSGGLIDVAMAFKDGAKKYGPYNWRKKDVRLTVYIDAALRHLFALLDGEDRARDSDHHHAAHAAACMFIILDALHCDNLIDDRPVKGPAGDLIEKYTEKQSFEGEATETTEKAPAREPSPYDNIKVSVSYEPKKLDGDYLRNPPLVFLREPDLDDDLTLYQRLRRALSL